MAIQKLKNAFIILMIVSIFLCNKYEYDNASINRLKKKVVIADTSEILNVKDIYDYNLDARNEFDEIARQGISLVPITTGEELVNIALAEVGNVGGEKYWTWFGCSTRPHWCVIFINWCANELGYFDEYNFPRSASVPYYLYWFKQNATFNYRYTGYEPKPGDIIFFDYIEDGVSDGTGDHVGIVEKCEDGYVYTIEGNYKDSTAYLKYDLNTSYILGYGTPNFVVVEEETD